MRLCFLQKADQILIGRIPCDGRIHVKFFEHIIVVRLSVSRGVFRKQRILPGGRFARDELSGVLIELPDCIISVLKYHSKISA